MPNTPYAIYVEERAVHVQWDARGPFVTLHESGDVSVQYREPGGKRIGFSGTAPVHERRSA